MTTSFQTMVAMRDGVALNTFVFLPDAGPGPFPVLVQRTPYGIVADGAEPTDHTRAWLPAPDEPLRGAILRGWEAITAHGYVAVYQDTRGRNGSAGFDRVYRDDAADGYDTLEWVASQEWSNGRLGVSGSSAGATTALAAASSGHPSLRAFFAQVGASSVYEDIVYEGNSIELERLWLWVADNTTGLSADHRAMVQARSGLSDPEWAAAAQGALERAARLRAAASADPPFTASDDWMRLPLTGYPDYTLLQPYLDEILRHPETDEFRLKHDLRSTIEIPGFHATTWYDIFSPSVIAAFREIQERVGNQLLWVGPRDHYFVYEERFWPWDPYFQWFDHWLKDVTTDLVDGPPVRFSPRSWVSDPERYVPDDWEEAASWPPPDSDPIQLALSGDGTLGPAEVSPESRSFRYDPADPLPTLGGRNMLIAAGPLDQSPIYGIEDWGLSYEGQPLTADLSIAGEVRAVLHVGSDCPDTDLVVKLIERTPTGEAPMIADGVTRVLYSGPGEGPRPLAHGEIRRVGVNLAHICHTFSAGSRIQLDVTSSNFPRRARNTNSGNPVLADDGDAEIRVATNTVHHGAEHPSHLVLPVRRC